MNRREIGKRVKKIRNEKKQTQAEFAEELDISTVYLGLVERGIKQPSLKVLERIAKVGNISIENFLIENELFEVWESETKDLKSEEKKKLANAFKELLIALKPILRKDK